MIMTKTIRQSNNSKVWTIGSILKWTQAYFTEKKISSPRLDAEVLLAYLLQKERIYLYVHFDEPLQENELTAFRNIIKKRAARIPVAYITGQKEFMGLTFKVSSAVLVPRPETELLVETAINKFSDYKTVNFADIGTGSGAIAISLAKLRNNFSGCAVDISKEALIIARTNAEIFQVSDKIKFLQGDLLAPLYEQNDFNKLDLIISNPPYIPLSDMDKLEPEIRKYEPANALTDNNDGLGFYRRLINDSSRFLTDNGALACEFGIGQSAAIKEMAQKNGWGKYEILKDLAGIERVIILWKQKY